MEGMKCYSGLRCLALLNYPVYGPVYHPVYRPVYHPVYRPVHRTVYGSHLFSCVFKKEETHPSNTPFHPRSAPPLHGLQRKHARGHTRRQPQSSHNPTSLLSLIFPLFALPLNSRTIAGDRNRSSEPFAQSHSKPQTNLHGQCVRPMLQELRQNSRFVAR